MNVSHTILRIIIYRWEFGTDKNTYGFSHFLEIYKWCIDVKFIMVSSETELLIFKLISLGCYWRNTS